MRVRKRDVLRDRNAVLFVGISLLSGFGGAVMSLVAGVWVMSLSGSSSLAALAGFCVFVPTLVGPILGAAVDRFPRRPLLIWTNLLTAGALLCLLAVGSAEQVWLIYVVMLAYGAGVVLLDAGEAALLPAALPAGALGDVNGLRMSAQEGMKLVAPLIGVGLFAWRGGRPVAVLTALVVTVTAGLYALIRSRPVPADSRSEQRTGQIRDGIRFLWLHPDLRVTVLIGSIAIAMSGFTTAALYAVVTDDLHRPATFLGVLASAQGALAILGGLLVGRMLDRYGELAVGALGSVLFAAGCAVRCVPWWPVTLVSSVVIGLGLPWTLVAATTAVQLRTPEGLVGRVAATANSLLFAPVAFAIPVGAVFVLVDHRLPLVIAATLCLVAGVLPVVPLGTRDRRLRPTSPAAHPAWPGKATPRPTQTPQSLPATSDGTGSGEEGRHR